MWLVHVVEGPPATYEIDFSRYEKELMEAADLRLRELKGKLDVEAPHTVIGGAVAEGVREEAERRGADLIVRAGPFPGRFLRNAIALVSNCPPRALPRVECLKWGRL